MSTEQEDAAMLLELEEKITRRIREQIHSAIYGSELQPGSVSHHALSALELRSALKNSILNDPYLITELTKKIGAKMANVSY